MFVGIKVLVSLSLLMFLYVVESEIQSDYFVLTLHWPNAYCYRSRFVCKEPVPQEFTIRRFRAFTGDHTRAKDNTASTFEDIEMEYWNFTQDLELYWPNLVRMKTNLRMWSKEWFHEGIPTGMNAVNYFYTAIEFGKPYFNLYHSLRESDIIPRVELYDREILHGKIANAVRSVPSLTCNVNEKGETQLWGVSICLNRQGVALDCPLFSTTCFDRRGVLFPTKPKSRRRSLAYLSVQAKEI